MKKVVSLLLIVSMLAAVFSLCLAGCGLFKSVTVDEAKENLTNAGYEVTVISGQEYLDDEDCEFPFIMSSELKTYLYAVKGEDKIKMFFFDSVDSASDNSNLIMDPDLYGGQSNNLIYLATKQARKDAGL